MSISDKKLIANREKEFIRMVGEPFSPEIQELFDISKQPNNSEWAFKNLVWKERCRAGQGKDFGYITCRYLDLIFDFYAKELLNRNQFDDMISPIYKGLSDHRTRGFFIGLVARKCMIEGLESEAKDAFIRIMSFNEDLVPGTIKIKTGKGMLNLDHALDGYSFKYRVRNFDFASWNAYITKSTGMESNAIDLFDKIELNYTAAEKIIRRNLGLKTRLSDDFTGFYPQINKFLTKSSEYLKTVYLGRRQRPNQDNIADFLNAHEFRSYWIKNTEPERVIAQYFEYFTLLHRYPKLFNGDPRLNNLPDISEIVHLESEEPRFKQLKTLYNLGVHNLKSDLKVVLGELPDIEDEDLISIGVEF